MKKYLLISLGLHIFFILFFGFIQTNQFEDEKLQKIVPITFVAKQVSDNPGSNVLANAPAPAPKKAEDKPKVEKKVEEKKIEKVEQKITKKETESKIADKNAKEAVKEEAQVNQMLTYQEEKMENLVELEVAQEMKPVMEVLDQTLLLMEMEHILLFHQKVSSIKL